MQNNGDLDLPNDSYANEQAVRSIQDMYVKEEDDEGSDSDIINNDLGDENFNQIPNDLIIQIDDEEAAPSPPPSPLPSTSFQFPLEQFQGQDQDGGQQNVPEHLMLTSRTQVVTTERSHFVKYVIRDGKHIKLWECGICSKEFGHQYTLMRHLPTHTDERRFRCNTCGKAFRQMSTLSQHRAIHSAERPYVCEVCRKTFNRVSTLISHRKTHTGTKQHRCNLCNKAFHQKGNLRNHVFTHTNERPYKCDVCAKGFNQMSNLMCHKSKAHQRTDKPRYACQLCEQDFPKRLALRNHEHYHHGVVRAVNTDLEPVPADFSILGEIISTRPEQLNVANNVSNTKFRYTTGVYVKPIETEAMKLAVSMKQTPFALLRPLSGIPVLVRILSVGDKQMLVPATAEDLRRHGQITIKSSQGCNNPDDHADSDTDRDRDPDQDQDVVVGNTGSSSNNNNNETNKGSTVQIKIPVVATVIQRSTADGSMSVAVRSPGPNKDIDMDDYMVLSDDDIDDDYDNNAPPPQVQEEEEINNELINETVTSSATTIITTTTTTTTAEFDQQQIQLRNELETIISAHEIEMKTTEILTTIEQTSKSNFINEISDLVGTYKMGNALDEIDQIIDQHKDDLFDTNAINIFNDNDDFDCDLL